MMLAEQWAKFEARRLSSAGQQQRSDMQVAYYTGALAVLSEAGRDGSPENLNSMLDECRVFVAALPGQTTGGSN